MPEFELSVTGLFAIKKAKLSTADVTVLVGPQASGKSVLSKALFFCRQYLDDLLFRQLESREDRRKFNQEKAAFFYELFPNSDVSSEEFEIEYYEGDFGFSVIKKRGGRRLSFKLSDLLEQAYNKYSSDYKRFVDRVVESDKSRSLVDTTLGAYAEHRSDFQSILNHLPETLYVPAARAFFSTLQNNVWRFLSEGGNFDPVLVQFGRAYENYRLRSRIGSRRRSGGFDFDTSSSEIIRAKYRRVGTEDFLDTPFGRVNVRHSSSGQQEALPLLFALHQFPLNAYENQMLIIEEPEAHLFPRAQKEMVSLIAEVAVNQACQMFVTTHSPYILSCLNNEHKKFSSDLSLTAYYVHDGGVEAIYDEQLGIIDSAAIDDVSEEIFNEYVNVSG